MPGVRGGPGALIEVAVVIEELTRQHRIQYELVLRNQALEAVDNGVLIADATADDLPIVFANAAFTRMSGYPEEEVLGRNCRFLQDEETDPDSVRQIRDSLRAGTGCLVTLRNRRKDGSHFWNELRIAPISDSAGRPSHFVAVQTDVTERRMFEQRLRDSESRYRTLFNSLDCGFCVFEMLYDAHGNSFDYRFLETNPEFDRHTGLRDAVGKTARALVPGLEQHWVDYYAEVANTGETRNFTEQSPAMGRWFDVHAFRFGEARLRQVALMFNDITERKRYEQTIEEARLAAERARGEADAANRAKSEFLANMSHEIRSPLSAILGFTEILGSSVEDADDLQAVDTIRANVDHLQVLLNDFLDLAKIEAGQLRIRSVPVALHDLVESVMSLMHVRAAESGLRLAVEYAGPLPESIETDPVRLRQILFNLLGNAIKFTDPGSGGESDVRLRVRVDTGAGARVVFDVIDTGIGLTPEQQAELFRPFSQADNSDTRRYEGTGLGLAISQRLANLLGGSIGVASERGQGSTFSFEIALDADGLAPMITMDETTRSSEPREALVVRLDAGVMIVDDRPDIRALLHHHLESVGARVESFADGESALARLAATAEPDRAPRTSAPPDGAAAVEPPAIDIVLLDMQMPGIDGYETTRRMRASGFARPIVALTAAALAGERERCLDAGCDDYLTKPIRRSQLLKAIAAHLRPARVTREAASRGVASAVAARRAPAPAPSGGRDVPDDDSPAPCRVLVVEDDRDTRQAMVKLLRLSGHDVVEAADADGTRAILSFGVPDVIFMDIGLPGTDGLALARELRGEATLRHTALFALTGHARLECSGDDPFDRHLLKPVNRATLLDALATGAPRD